MSVQRKAAETAKVRLLRDQEVTQHQDQQRLFALAEFGSRLESAVTTLLIARLSGLAERDVRCKPVLARLTRADRVTRAL